MQQIDRQVLFLLLICLMACRQPEVVQQYTPAAPSTTIAPTATNTATLSPTATSSPTLTPTATPTLSPSPTNTPRPPTRTATPTTTPTPLPTPSFLTIRNPTFEQLESYLQSTTVRMYDRQNREHVINDLSPPEDAPTAWRYPFSQTQFHYEDVNADGEDDLLLLYADPFFWSGPVYLFVLVWNGDRYEQPLMLVDGSKLSAGTRFALEDVLGDASPELHWFTDTGTSGSGYYASSYEHYIVRCETECNVLWHGLYAGTSYSFNVVSGGESVEHTMSTTRMDIADDFDQIWLTEQTFAVPVVRQLDSTPLEVFDVTEKVYQWDGEKYALVNTTVITPAYTYQPTPRLEAERDSAVAIIEATFVPVAYDDEDEYAYSRYDCTVFVNDVPIDDDFGCNPQYMHLSWQDVLADGRDELVVMTLFEYSHRLLIWQQWGEGYRQIAAIRGHINTPDLSDMQLVDVDDDPELELLAGRLGHDSDEFCFVNSYDNELCWFEVTLDQVVYQWNGWEYVREPSR